MIFLDRAIVLGYGSVMAIVKMTRGEIVAKINMLWSAHESAVSQRLEARDREALDKLAKFLNMPQHIRTALDWSYTRSMIGDLGRTPEAKAKGKAYYSALDWVMSARDMHEPINANTADHAFFRQKLVTCEGACAGYLFAAKERIGQ